MKKLKVGIIGCGAIGRVIAEACVNRLKDKIELACIFDVDKTRSDGIAKSIKPLKVGESVESVFKNSDLIVEAAGAAVVRQLIKDAIRFKKDVLVMSVGGALGAEDLLTEADKNNVRVFMPSGALAGIDAIKAASMSRIDSVTLTTRKSPESLKGAPHFEKSGLDLSKLKTDTLVFEGSAKDAVQGFPKNINVSAIISFAGIGAQKTRVKIYACPGLDKNIHEVTLVGDSGTVRTITENVPSPDNPKTSYLAALSAVACLKGIVDNIRFGN